MAETRGSTKAKLSHIFWVTWYVILVAAFCFDIGLMIENDLLREMLKGMR